MIMTPRHVAWLSLLLMTASFASCVTTDRGPPPAKSPATSAAKSEVKQVIPPLSAERDASAETRLVGHWDSLNAIAFDEFGKVATGSDDMTVRVWDLATHKELLRLSGHGQPVTTVAMSPDRMRVASGSYDRTIRIWSVAAGIEVGRLLGHTRFISAVMFLPGGGRLLSASHDGTVKLWDVGTGALLKTLAGHRGTVNALALSPDARILATGGDDKSIVLWDLASGKQIKRLLGAAGWITSVDFSSDGNLLVAGSADKSARIWDAKTGQEIMRLTGHRSPVSRVRFAANDSLVVTGGGAEALVPDPEKDDFSVGVYRVAGGQEVARFKGHTAPVAAIRLAESGSIIVTGSLDETIRTWVLPR